MTDAELLAAMRAADRTAREAAFTTLFERLRGPVLALCRQLMGDAADAEDALQETFVAVHAGLPRFRGEARLSTWVYRIAIRTTARQRARRGRRAAEPLVVDPPAPASDAALSAERRELLDRAMARLSAEQRAVLSLFSLDGLSHAEVAEILGIPIGTVWSRLHAARQRLLGLLAD